MKTRRHSQRGQTAVIALLVLLLLSFIGALFITIIARNLKAQGRSHRTLNADYYAEAGLRYADAQLTTSLDGADWRPPLQNQVTAAFQPQDTVGANRYKLANLPAVVAQDPDRAYLQQGFTRYNTQNGRFLLRVTYDPIHQSSQDNPTARYLKIESVGREGTVDPTDPTTFQNQPVTRLAATQVAYKPIGITDYARFETNIDNRSDIANLGVPSIVDKNNNILTPGVFDLNIPGNVSPPQVSLTQYPILITYGSPDAYLKSGGNALVANPIAGQGSYTGTAYTPYSTPPGGFTYVPGGGSIRANMSLRLYGENIAYLNRDPTTTQLDDIEVAGNLLLDSYTLNGSLTTNQRASLAVQTSASGAAVPNQYPSNDQTDFSTQTGAVRDGGSGSSASDANGNPRDVARLDPPVIDAASSATNLTRYQAITENSPPRVDPTTMTFMGNPTDVNSTSGSTYPPTLGDGNSAGLDGYGQAIYINNTSDVQRDSTSLVGGHTLMDEWLNTNGGGQTSTNTKGGWVGPYYNPPGAEIIFGPQRVQFGTGQTATSLTKYGFRIVRSDTDNSGNPVSWKTPAGGSLGPTLAVSYDELRASNDPTADPGKLNQAELASYRANPNNDVLIYAEGNVRVLGSVSAAPGGSGVTDDSVPRHVTVITNGTAYIDGNVLKGNPDSSITILARDYVCVNTTQFVAGAAEFYPGISDGLLTFTQDSDLFVQEFSFGAMPQAAYPGAKPGSGANGAPASPLALYVSGGAGASGSVLADFDITNPLIRTPQQDLPEGINSLNPPVLNPFDGSLINASLFDSGAGTGPSSVIHRTYNLYNSGNLTPYNLLLNASSQQPFQLWTRRDPGTDSGPNAAATTATPDQPFQLERTAILPMDIRIEAVLYAQNKSFFVIPGTSFNSDPGDDLLTYYNQYLAYQNATGAKTLPSRPGIDSLDPNQTRFPFFGQPIDLKITILGSVSEARPAQITSQAAWMQRWGWIPRYHGSPAFLNSQSSTTPSPNFEPSGRNRPPKFQDQQPALGLTFIYDPQDGYPYNPSGNITASGTAGPYYLRSDIYGRPLPLTPKLPVSTGLLYAGQPTGQSLLQ